MTIVMRLDLSEVELEAIAHECGVRGRASRELVKSWFEGKVRNVKEDVVTKYRKGK